MYATVRRAKFRQGSIEEVVQKVRDSFVPALNTMSGFVNFYLVRLENDSVSTVSIFETQSDAEQANAFFAQWVRSELGSLLQGAPEIAVGEVAVQATK